MRQTVLSILIYQVIFLLVGTSFFTPVMAAEVSGEYQLKAGFISNFLRFIEWPSQAFTDIDSDIVICVVGSNPFGSALEVISKKKVGKRRVDIIYTESSKDTPSCHLLYVSKSMSENLDAVFSNIGNRAIVTVSDLNGFAVLGGAIEFITKNDRLSFIINNTDLKKRDISARASMLNLAASVY